MYDSGVSPPDGSLIAKLAARQGTKVVPNVFQMVYTPTSSKTHPRSQDGSQHTQNSCLPAQVSAHQASPRTIHGERNLRRGWFLFDGRRGCRTCDAGVHGRPHLSDLPAGAVRAGVNPVRASLLRRVLGTPDEQRAARTPRASLPHLPSARAGQHA